MGRITIFSADDCPHCARAFAELAKHDIPYVNISVTQYPPKRNDMLALSSRLSTPQIFFNTRHIGGADDLLEQMQKWAKPDKKSRYKTPYERYQYEIERHPDPTNPRLAFPDYPPVPIAPAPTREHAHSVTLPDGSKATVLEVTEALKQMLPITDHSRSLMMYNNAFTGSQAVGAFMKHYNISEEQAVKFGQHLHDLQLIHPVLSEQDGFTGSSTCLLRLQCHHTPHILNSYRIWTEPGDPNPIRLLANLRKLMSKVESPYTDNAGLTNLHKASQSPDYPTFEEAVCELQTVNLSAMDENTKLAFGINLYNLMVKYGFLKLGVGENSASRTVFFTSVLFNVGGFLFSLQDWENGILRGNKKAPHGLSRPFTGTDPRIKFAVTKPDYRIHFGLNCGARSCPPVNNYNPDDIDEEMRIVAQAFCEDDDNVLVDPKKREVKLSKIFHWYKADFDAGSNTELLKVVVQHLHGVKRQALEGLLRSNDSIKVTFFEYDWTPHAMAYKSFDSKLLKPNRRCVKALFRKDPSKQQTLPSSARTAAAAS